MSGTPTSSASSALRIATGDGADGNRTINPHLRRRAQPTVEEPAVLAGAIVARDRSALSRAITLVESGNLKQRDLGEVVVDALIHEAGGSLRIGITGVPGVGKSTLIEALGMHLIEAGHRVAVLAVDPSSVRSRGSILGDKTRMNRLAAHPAAFVRPSPTSGTLGGVARATRETITLVEAAGFDVVLVETVGVGQSETAVHALVDCFVLLTLAGAGDGLQGIKRGIMEMADVMAVTKADGDGLAAAQDRQAQLLRAIRLIAHPLGGWTPPVVLTSAAESSGLGALWDAVQRFICMSRDAGRFHTRRNEQVAFWLDQAITAGLRDAFDSHHGGIDALYSTQDAVRGGTESPFRAARRLISAFLSSLSSP